MYLEDESHSYHISSLMDRKMKGEKLDGNLEKGFGMLRKDNQPQRARSLSLWLYSLEVGPVPIIVSHAEDFGC